MNLNLNQTYFFLYSILILLAGCRINNFSTINIDNNPHPLGISIYGQQINGCEGDFSSYSDVFIEHGIRISPGNKDGLVYYDFGPVNRDSVYITFQWTDNGWVSGLKTLEIFNWQSKTWEIIASWKGNDKKTYINTYGIKIKHEYLGFSKQIRIGLFASKFAIIHLDNILVQ